MSGYCHRSPETSRVQAWIIDDTGFPKKGHHSVGVARQYCGQLGKQDNCQVAVSLSVATHQGSLPVAYRLYLPKDWADDPVRRTVAGVPDDIRFQTKPEIALQQMRQALAAGVPPGVVLADPAYGNDSKFRAGITELGLALRARYPAHHEGLAARRGAIAAGAQIRSRPARQAIAPRRDASAGLGQDAGPGACRRCLAADRPGETAAIRH